MPDEDVWEDEDFYEPVFDDEESEDEEADDDLSDEFETN